MYARRRGPRWFVGVLNGPRARTVTLALSFLGPGRHQAVLVRDKGPEGDGLVEARAVASKDVLELPLRAGGGFVMRIDPAAP